MTPIILGSFFSSRSQAEHCSHFHRINYAKLKKKKKSLQPIVLWLHCYGVLHSQGPCVLNSAGGLVYCTPSKRADEGLPGIKLIDWGYVQKIGINHKKEETINVIITSLSLSLSRSFFLLGKRRTRHGIQENYGCSRDWTLDISVRDKCLSH